MRTSKTQIGKTEERTIEPAGAELAANPANKPSRPRKAKGKKPAVKAATHAETKTNIVLNKLRSAKGVTIAALTEATGWQQHSVRGFLSGTVKKKLGLALISETGKDGVRRYRIETAAKAG